MLPFVIELGANFVFEAGTWMFAPHQGAEKLESRLFPPLQKERGATINSLKRLHSARAISFRRSFCKRLNASSVSLGGFELLFGLLSIHLPNQYERSPKERMVVALCTYLLSCQPQGLKLFLAGLDVLEEALHQFDR